MVLIPILGGGVKMFGFFESRVGIGWVGDFIPWLPDHCPLRFTLEFHQPKQNIEKESNMKDATKQFIWTQEGIAKFQKELNKIENTSKIDNIMWGNYRK